MRLLFVLLLVGGCTKGTSYHVHYVPPGSTESVMMKVQRCKVRNGTLTFLTGADQKVAVQGDGICAYQRHYPFER